MAAQEPQAFLSYAHFDDEFHGGAITKLRKRLQDAVRAVTGRPFHVFQDKDGIEIGQRWLERLDESLGQARFLIPILTPSYFESEGCRDELEKFLKLEEAAGRSDLILPLLYLDTWQLRDAERKRADRLVAEMSKRQWRDWREYADIDPEDAKVRPALKLLAAEIGETLRSRGKATRRPNGLSPIPSLTRTPGLVFRDVDAFWCPEMVVMPAGQFVMGSPDDEEERHENEGPLHKVIIAAPFAVGRYPITRGEFAKFIDDTGHGMEGGIYRWDGADWKPDPLASWRAPGFAQTDRDPVVGVSWTDAMAYVGWLAEKTRQAYRLLSEAEWEYAARGGTTTPFWMGATISTDRANYNGNFKYRQGRKGIFRKRTIAVDDLSSPANPFGLKHVLGNVLEWVEDCYHDSYEGAPADGSAWITGDGSARVLRGGSWFHGPGSLRVAIRYRSEPNTRGDLAGLRIARALGRSLSGF